MIACEQTCGSDVFQVCAKKICDGDFWRQSMSQIIFQKRTGQKPVDGFVQINTSFPETVQFPLYTHAELLRMRKTPPTRECLTSIPTQRWGRPLIDLTQGILWYKPTVNEAGDITRLGWQNLPDWPIFEAKQAMVGSAF